jgi:hypothetical protein
MDDNRQDDADKSPDAGRPRRAPPTIDLEASEVTASTASDGADNAGDKRSSRVSSKSLTPLWVAALTGAVTAALVIAIAWAAGWPADTARPPAESNAGAIEALSTRLADLEGRVSKPAAPDAALAARLEALDKSLASLRTDIAGARAQSAKLASDLEAVKAAPPAPVAAPAPPDLTGIEGRLAEVERAVRAESERITEAASQPADDVALRRLVVASMLDLSVRQGEPFPAALKAARALAADPQLLKPLDDFAASGVPNAAALCRELLTLVPKLEPPAAASVATGTSIVDRLQAGAAKLVRIERTDLAGNDRGAVVARITAAAIRNDLSEARRELAALDPADRAPAQAWLDKAERRDAALAASHRFAAEAMAALAKPAP